MAERYGQHDYEWVADRVIDSLQTEPDEIVDAITGGGPAPFAAHVTEKQKREYYRATLFNPDGSPNPEGRRQTIERVGIKGFVQVMADLQKREEGLTIPSVSVDPPSEPTGY